METIINFLGQTGFSGFVEDPLCLVMILVPLF